ncbi:lactonase family protein [Metallumcola ferriviriculae]|uniref:Lactonase family protein n=1 Tax=Metallumcola ferriviriculae TaxID=3039180 RepID=A0AAU0UPL7_9FIRM|nr:lactonase family protein [Desulfitibacteraceae bacterium MK1]
MSTTLGTVYVMTNSRINNEVVAFRRGPDGTLSLIDAYKTGGHGTGTRRVSPETPGGAVDPLASQGSIALSDDKRFLFAVNAGSNNISSFRRNVTGELILVDKVPSGGLQPNSLAVHEKLLYVSNAGSDTNGSDSNITGFRIGARGELNRVPNSESSLSTPNAHPASVVFTPDGSQLVVSELTTNHLSVFDVKPDGTVSRRTVNRSSGAGPFGSYFLPSGLLLNSEAGTNALSSYTVSPDGILNVISGSVESGQMATCWVVATRNERFAYTSNTGSGTISFYSINTDGTLELVENIPSTPEGSPMGAPIDSGVSRDQRNFYVLNGNQGSISVFQINSVGQLIRLQVIDSEEVPTLGAQGLTVI